MHPRVLELIRAHRTTIVFCNARRTRRTARGAASTSSPAKSSCARTTVRSRASNALQVESELKAGRLRGIVATSAASSSASTWARSTSSCSSSRRARSSRGLQRVGRAGHQVGEPSTGKIFPKYRGDLLEAAIVVRAHARRARRGDALPAQPARRARAADRRRGRDRRVGRRRAARARAAGARTSPTSPTTCSARRSTCSRAAIPSDQFAGLRPRVVWDRVAEPRARARRRAARRGRERRHHPRPRPVRRVPPRRRPRRRARRGDGLREPGRRGFVLGASTWRIEEITFDRVVVTPAPGEPAKTPFWKGDKPGPAARARPRARRARARAARRPTAAGRGEAAARAGSTTRAASNLRAYLDEQAEATGAVPDDRTIVIERFPDEIGDWRVCILTPFGARVHAPWALAIEEQLARARPAGAGAVERRRHHLPPARVARRDPARRAARRPRRARRARRRRGCRARRCSRRGSARTRRARCCCPAAGPASARRCGSSASAPADLLEVASGYPDVPDAARDHARVPPRRVRPARAARGAHRRSGRASVRVVPGRDAARVAVRADRCCSAGSRCTCTRATRRSPNAASPRSRSTATCCATCSAPRSCASCSTPRCIAELELELQRLVPDRHARHADDLHDLLADLGPLDDDEVRGPLPPPIPTAWIDALLGRAPRHPRRRASSPRSRTRRACATRSARDPGRPAHRVHRSRSTAPSTISSPATRARTFRS